MGERLVRERDEARAEERKAVVSWLGWRSPQSPTDHARRVAAAEIRDGLHVKNCEEVSDAVG